MKQHIKALALLILVHASSIYAPQLIIARPGTHILDISRSYAPSAANDTIIQVDANNVVLDFKGKAIDQHFDNAQPGLDGITVSAAVSEVTIQNAHIKNISGVGIRVNNACNKISILDSIIESCDGGGILLDGSIPGVTLTTITNATILTCTGAAGAPAYGIRTINGTSIRINNCLIAQTDASTTSSGYGISLENCMQTKIMNSLIPRTGGSGIAAGVSIVNGSGILLDNVFVERTTNHDTTFVGTAYGFNIDQSTSVLGTGCRSSLNVNNGSFCYGLAIQNGQKNVFEGFISGFNQSDNIAAGILLQNEQQSVIQNSTARGTNALTGTAYGILLSGTCDRCSLATNAILNTSGSTNSFGIADQRSQSTSLILGNNAFNNGTNYSVTYPDGVNLPVTEASLSEFPGTDDISTNNAYMNLSITP